MHEHVAILQFGQVVDRGWLVARTGAGALVESDRPGMFAAHPVHAYPEADGYVVKHISEVAPSPIRFRVLF